MSNFNPKAIVCLFAILVCSFVLGAAGESKNSINPEAPRDEVFRVINSLAVADDPGPLRIRLLSPHVFDWQSYMVLNPNLMGAGVTNQATAESHWLLQGAGEGRQANGSFSVRNYVIDNVGINAWFGNDFRKAILHYVLVGREQGLTGYPSTFSFGGVLPDIRGFKGNAVVGNRVLTITTSSQFAGAVDGVYFNGCNFVNNYDHGRQIQTASWDRGMGEANNPNEAGWHKDRDVTSSRLLSLDADSSSIATVVHPAYYLRNGETSPFSPKEITFPPPAGATFSKDPYFSKKIQVNVNGDPQVFSILTQMHIMTPLTSTIFQPSFVALNREFSAFYELGDDFVYKPITYNKRPTARTRPVILSTVDGRYAMGVYSPSLDGTKTVYSGSYYDWGNPLNPSNDTANLSVAYCYPSTVQGGITQIVYFVVGKLDDVRPKLQALVKSTPGKKLKL